MASFNKAGIEWRLLGKQLFEQARDPGPSSVDDCLGMNDLFDATRRLSQSNYPMPIPFFESNAFGIGPDVSAMPSSLLRIEYNESRVINLCVPILKSLRNRCVKRTIIAEANRARVFKHRTFRKEIVKEEARA